MAYNLQSLITILEQILNPEQNRWFLGKSKPKLQSLLQKASSLQKILEKPPLTKKENLEIQIRDVAYRAEDIIESHMVDRMLSMPESVGFTLLAPDVDQVTQELDSIMEQVMKLVEAEGSKKMPTGSGSSWSGASFSTSKSVVVGVNEDLVQLKDRLTRVEKKLEIIPIVGMGGIGKTTLAQKLYQDAFITSHFKFRGWTTISQDYSMHAILLTLIRCIIGKETDEQKDKRDDELKDILYKSLYGRRYMLVLDDIWGTNFWNEIKKYFPDNNNGSRIVITTRESDAAKYTDSRSLHHEVKLLSKSVSWDLLRQIVFGEEDCHDDVLQGIGEKIASDCGGLPLAINVIGGLLSKVERSKEVWENVGNDVRAAIVESDKQFSNILSLSYNHLPNHLKPCLLYMGVFPEDYEIRASRLIWMWIAEGFVKTSGEKNLEEEAKDCLKALVERNLLFVKHYKHGKPHRYMMHDLLRDVCMRKGNEERFLHVKNGAGEVMLFANTRRVSVQTSYGIEEGYALAELASLARSFLMSAKLDELLSPVFFTLTLLRVLDVMNMSFEDFQFPVEILQLVNLRYLAISRAIPSGISKLWNLQTLIARSSGSNRFPSEIWEMSELKHLKVDKIWFEDKYVQKYVLKNLQTISWVRLTSLLIRWGLFECIPNVKELGIVFQYIESDLVDLSRLHKLEKLRCKPYLNEDSCHFLLKIKYPRNLRRLSLYQCAIFPTVLKNLCALPDLELLSMKDCVFDSECEVWEVAEGDVFRSLQFLHLESLNLVSWRADETNFPELRNLVIKFCSELEEIPCGIGYIPKLRLIELEYISASVEDSAKQIQEVQQSDENYDIQLRIGYVRPQ